MISIKQIEVGDWLRFADGSGPVKVIGLWPYAIEVKLGVYEHTIQVVNSDTRMIDMQFCKIDALLYK